MGTGNAQSKIALEIKADSKNFEDAVNRATSATDRMYVGINFTINAIHRLTSFIERDLVQGAFPALRGEVQNTNRKMDELGKVMRQVRDNIKIGLMAGFDGLNSAMTRNNTAVITAINNLQNLQREQIGAINGLKQFAQQVQTTTKKQKESTDQEKSKFAEMLKNATILRAYSALWGAYSDVLDKTIGAAYRTSIAMDNLGRQTKETFTQIQDSASAVAVATNQNVEDVIHLAQKMAGSNLKLSKDTTFYKDVLHLTNLNLRAAEENFKDLLVITNAYNISSGKVMNTLTALNITMADDVRNLGKMSREAKEAGLSFSQLAALMKLVKESGMGVGEQGGEVLKTLLDALQNVKGLDRSRLFENLSNIKDVTIETREEIAKLLGIKPHSEIFTKLVEQSDKLGEAISIVDRQANEFIIKQEQYAFKFGKAWNTAIVGIEHTISKLLNTLERDLSLNKPIEDRVNRVVQAISSQRGDHDPNSETGRIKITEEALSMFRAEYGKMAFQDKIKFKQMERDLMQRKINMDLASGVDFVSTPQWEELNRKLADLQDPKWDERGVLKPPPAVSKSKPVQSKDVTAALEFSNLEKLKDKTEEFHKNKELWESQARTNDDLRNRKLKVLKDSMADLDGKMVQSTALLKKNAITQTDYSNIQKNITIVRNEEEKKYNDLLRQGNTETKTKTNLEKNLMDQFRQDVDIIKNAYNEGMISRAEENAAIQAIVVSYKHKISEMKNLQNAGNDLKLLEGESSKARKSYADEDIKAKKQAIVETNKLTLELESLREKEEERHRKLLMYSTQNPYERELFAMREIESSLNRIEPKLRKTLGGNITGGSFQAYMKSSGEREIATRNQIADPRTKGMQRAELQERLAAIQLERQGAEQLYGNYSTLNDAKMKWLDDFRNKYVYTSEDTRVIVEAGFISTTNAIIDNAMQGTLKLKDLIIESSKQIFANILKEMANKAIRKFFFNMATGGTGGIWESALSVLGASQGTPMKGAAKKFSFGSMVSGAGGDSIPSVLSPGEIVLDKNASDLFRETVGRGSMGASTIVVNVTPSLLGNRNELIRLDTALRSPTVQSYNNRR